MAAKVTETLTIRLDPELRERMDRIRLAMPYKPNITTIVERGITLALEEIERLTKIAEERQ